MLYMKAFYMESVDALDDILTWFIFFIFYACFHLAFSFT